MYPDAKAVFFGASYHADYATLLCAPADLAAAAAALSRYCASEGDPGHPTPWDAVDLRRLRCGDPAAEALEHAFARLDRERGWMTVLEREEVCPVTTLADTQRPSRPARFHKVARSGGYVTFDWSPSVDNVGVAKYYVFRVGRASPVRAVKVSRIRLWTARGAKYYVRAVDAAGNRSAASATAVGRR